MATIANLVGNGRLDLFDAEFGPGEQQERNLYLSPGCADWIDGTLAYSAKQTGRDLIPYEQLYNLFTSFVRGDQMYLSSDFNKIIPQGDHV